MSLAKHFASMRMSLTCALVVSVCIVDSVTIAYDGSLMGSINTLPSYNSYFGITSRTQGIMSGATFAGALVIAPIASKFIDWKGRKMGIFFSALMNILGAVIGAASQNQPMFIAGRVLIGMGVGIAQTSCSSYVSETTAPSIRAFALGLYFTCWAIGSFIATGVTRGSSTLEPSDWAWRLPTLLQGVIPIVVLIVLFFLPESPRWLVFKGRHDEALRALARVSNDTPDSAIVQTQFREIVDTIEWENQEGRKTGFREAFRTAPNRRRVFLAMSVAPLVMLAGNNVITYYFGTMLTQAGIDDEKTQLEINLGLSAFQFCIALTGSSLAERLGRRWLALISLGLCTVFFYMIGGLTARFGESSDRGGVIGTVVAIYLFLGSYSFGITPLTSIYPPEVMSFSLRATGAACFAVTNEICGFFVTMVFPFMFESLGWKTYMVNASWNILIWLFVFFFWVETKGKTLEEISEIFDGEKHSSVPDLAVVQEKTEVAGGKVEYTVESNSV